VVCPLSVAGLKSFLHERATALRWLACGFAVALFVWSMAFFYLPGLGFTYLIEFSSLEHDRYVPEVKTVDHYEADTPGYDSQWYVQIALHPRLRDPVLWRATDSLPYRARRILFLWTAWALGGGDPARVMNIYALQNVVCWFLLAGLLMRWFPPVAWGNVFRWAATLFSFGLIFSVRGALPDGPSFLLVAVGIALIESERLWLGALVVGVAGLGKDTSILCGAALRPADPRNPRTWAPWIGRGLLFILPLAAWMLYIRLHLGHGEDIGSRNFARPFAGLMNKLQDTLSSAIAERHVPYPTVTKFDALVLVGILAQFFFFAFRVRWRDPWWRVGASYALLMAFLGDAVWEHYPSAAARVLLPMTLAFNVSVPRRGLWPILLIAGNLGVFASADLLKPPGRESFVVEGPKELRINPADGKVVEAVFGPKNWWKPEKSRWDYFRWSMGDSSVALHNPQPFGIVADVTFKLRSVDRRGAVVILAGKVVWQAKLEPAEVTPVTLSDVYLPPGDTILIFQSDRAAAFPGNGDRRRLTYMVRDLEIDLKARHQP
jgi:hypothetical protein